MKAHRERTSKLFITIMNAYPISENTSKYNQKITSPLGLSTESHITASIIAPNPDFQTPANSSPTFSVTPVPLPSLPYYLPRITCSRAKKKKGRAEDLASRAILFHFTLGTTQPAHVTNLYTCPAG